MTLNELLAQLPEGIYQTVARVILVIVAILLIIILRRILTWLILRPLRRIVARSGYENEDKALDVVLSPMRYFIIAVALLISIQIIPTTIGVNMFVLGIARSLIIFAVLLFIYNLVDLIAPL